VTAFFGARWDAPVVDDAEQVPTPVGERCYDCGEAVADGDRGFIRVCVSLDDDGRPVGSARPVHAECDLRGVLGHRYGLCHCNGYSQDRDTARAVWQRAGEERGRPLEQRTEPPR
jgi:hypothetical protein